MQNNFACRILQYNIIVRYETERISRQTRFEFKAILRKNGDSLPHALLLFEWGENTPQKANGIDNLAH
jgi:hypothetical protein